MNPECEHVQGDMRSVRLGRDFDAVFVHDAVMYLTSEADLQAAIRTAAAHCRKGGHDGDGRSARYIQWDYDPDAADTWYWADFVLLLREGAGPARVFHDRHELGLFPRETWLGLCWKEGLDPQVLTPAHSEVGHLNLILAEKRD